MVSHILIRIAVAISLLASLVLGPAFAAPSPAPTAGSQHMTMSGGMDCCPKKQSDPRCAKCPLMALCATPMAAEDFGLRLPSLVATGYRHAVPADEAYPLGRESSPLPEPPRSLI